MIMITKTIFIEFRTQGNTISFPCTPRHWHICIYIALKSIPSSSKLQQQRPQLILNNFQGRGFEPKQTCMNNLNSVAALHISFDLQEVT
jgi:hypothetical protein